MPARILENAVFPFVHARDVAEAIARAAERPDNLGAKYFVVAENLTFGDINRMLGEIANVSLPSLRLPTPLVVGTVGLLTLIADITKKPPLWGLCRDQVGTMRAGTVFSGAKAERELGITYTPIR
jgi:dihydroflavonol-4-reductase